MFNAISTPDDDAQEITVRRRWRVVFLLLTLAGLLYGSYHSYQQLAARYLAERQDDYLALAGPIAEEAEINMVDAVRHDGQLHGALLPTLFVSYADLAAVRVWSPELQVQSEMIRNGVASARFVTPPALGDLGARQALQRVEARRQELHWTDPIAQLQLIAGEQRAITDELDYIFEYGDSEKSNEELYRRQEQLLSMVARMDEAQPLLAATRDHMNDVLDALPKGNDGLAQAILASNAVLGDLTAALTKYRATISKSGVLPSQLTRHAANHGSWLTRLLPIMQGQRILIPLFAPAVSSALLTPVGYLETLHYFHPADALFTMRLRDALFPGVLFVLLLTLLIWPRPRQMADD